MIPYLDAAALRERVDPAAAVAAIRRALLNGLDPAADPPRTVLELSRGQLLLMPSNAGGAGVKVVTIAPDNPAADLPRIQGLYVLFNEHTLAPSALLDGIELTSLRTPAVSVAAAQAWLRPGPLEVVVFGAGPQALRHVETLRACGFEVHPRYVTRSGPDLIAGTPAADHAAGSADLIVCATTARTPLFDGGQVRDDAVVIAVGAHEPDARELPADLLGRSTVVVEDVATALREAGDVVMAIAEGALSVDRLLPMTEAVRVPAGPPRDRPLVVKTVGMAWQDLVVARLAAAG